MLIFHECEASIDIITSKGSLPLPVRLSTGLPYSDHHLSRTQNRRLHQASNIGVWRATANTFKTLRIETSGPINLLEVCTAIVVSHNVN